MSAIQTIFKETESDFLFCSCGNGIHKSRKLQICCVVHEYEKDGYLYWERIRLNIENPGDIEGYKISRLMTRQRNLDYGRRII